MLTYVSTAGDTISDPIQCLSTSIPSQELLCVFTHNLYCGAILADKRLSAVFDSWSDNSKHIVLNSSIIACCITGLLIVFGSTFT